jgi:uncharacterized protein (DUF305 family)
MQHEMHHKPYLRLLAMVVLSFIAMYGLMYAMVDRFANVLPNLNQAYMAGLMTAPMVLIELALMSAMYPNRRANAVIGVSAAVLLALCWIAIRQQAAIGDREFLRSMIPHHAGAILMCGKAPVQDLEVQKLCQSIVSSQQAEIDQMKTILARLERQ